MLSISDHKLFPEDIGSLSFHDNLERDTRQDYVNHLSYVFIELPKFTKTINELEREQDYWIFMMKSAEA